MPTATTKRQTSSRKRALRRRKTTAKSGKKTAARVPSRPYPQPDKGPDEKDRAFLGRVQEELERLE